MQDNYVGDIGDYGKYGLLREICSKITLAVNWYRVVSTKMNKHEDGKFINYLLKPSLYREYDPALFDSLYKIVVLEDNRRIERIEEEGLFQAIFYSEILGIGRNEWHDQALKETKNAKAVFLDPDNGLETDNMYRFGGATEKHVKWTELKDYYERGQNVILYQHRPQMITKEKCIESIMYFQRNYLLADCIRLLEFPKYTNRFYFMFLHETDRRIFDSICSSMVQKWGKNDFCHEIIL